MRNDSYEEDYEDLKKVPAPRRNQKAKASPAAKSGAAAKRAPAPAKRPPAKGASAASKKRPPTSYGTKRRAPARRKKPRANPMVTLLIWVVAVAVAFAVSFMLRAYVFDLVTVSGDAMYESMMSGDVVFIDKLAYGDGAPKRGDVVALRVPGQNGVMLRRIVGLPGETVQLTGGETYIGEEILYEQYVGLKNYDSYPAMTLAADRYYVLGDNRSETTDSRDERIGLVSRSQIEGKARYVVWPLSHLGSF